MSIHWRAWIREGDDGWRWKVRAPDGRRWTGTSESFARAWQEAGEQLRSAKASEDALIEPGYAYCVACDGEGVVGPNPAEDQCKRCRGTGAEPCVAA